MEAINTDLAARNEQLQESEARFRILVDQASDAFFLHDSSGKFLDVNRRACESLGYTRDELLKMSISQVGTLDVNEAKARWAVMVPGQTHTLDEYHRRKDGTTFPVEVSLGCFKVNGQRRFLGLARDITERKRAEEALVESEHKFRTLFDVANDGIFIMHDGNFVDCNASILKMFDVTRDQIIGHSPEEFSPPTQPDGRSSREKALEKMQTALAGGTQFFEWVFRRPDGTLIDAEASLSDFELNGKVYFHAIVRDTRERKLAIEQIAEQAAFLDKAQDAISVRDLDGKILFWNKGAERIYGWTRQEAVGQSARELIYKDGDSHDEAHRAVLAQDEWTGEVQHLTKDRRLLTLVSRFTLVRDKEGHPKSVLVINTDITEKKKIEGQFIRAQRLESIGTLAGGIAHDLNNILAPILMSIDLLKSTVNQPQANKILETIEVSAKRGSDIVRQVLSFARGMEGKRIEVKPEPLLKDLESILADTFPKDIRLQFSVANDIWMIFGDPTQVHQVLLNLCLNARDAMPNGGSLIIRAENCLLDEQYAAIQLKVKAGRYVVLCVTDSGTGMTQDIVDKIFDPFFTTKESGKGTGLGLSTALAIVRGHDGFIDITSELGLGTTFKVYLPAMTKSSEARKEEVKPISLPRGNGEMVLLVDDEGPLLAITNQTLLAFGYQVLTARNGAEAVALFAQHRKEITIVVTDMAMPIMDGLATIQAVTNINPLVKIIAVSGLHANENVAKASSAGVKYFLTKPYTAGTLLKTLRKVLDED